MKQLESVKQIKKKENHFMKTSLIILAIVANSIMAFGQSRIGSGDQGLQGLLAANYREIIPGDEVVVSPPSPNNNDRVLVMADGELNPKQKNEKYCVIVMKKGEDIYRYGSLSYDEIKICKNVGESIFLKGNLNIAIVFSESIAFFKKKANEELVIKLAKIKIPQREEIAQSEVSRHLTEDSELGKLLFTKWLYGSVSICMSAKEREEYFKGNYALLKKCIKDLPDGNILLYGHPYIYNISKLSNKGGVVYVLPGTYKIKWYYTNGSTQTTLGIVLK